MPNWCYTVVNISSPDKEKLKVLSDEFDKALDKDDSLYSLLLHLDLGESEIKKINHRGSITYYETFDDYILMDVESAWSPTLEPIRLFCEKYDPSAEILYTAEEPGCEVFLSNNDEDVGQWRIIYGGDDPYFEDCQEPFSNDELKDLLEDKIRPLETKGLSQLIETIRDVDNGFYVNRYSYCSIEDL